MPTGPLDGGGTPAPIRYTLSFPAPHTHYAEVTALVPTSGQTPTDLMMAVWTPGSYMVREYSRHIEGVTAVGLDGRALPVEKTRKNRWRVDAAGAPAFTLKYRVYGREMSVRTNWIEDRFALMNGGPTFMTLADGVPRLHDVAVTPAAAWGRVMTGLPEVSGTTFRYHAPDFDTLVDSPMLLGNPSVYEFSVGGTPHWLVNEGEGGVFDGARARADVEAIVRAQERLWGALPYDRYLFLNLLTEGRGGLEHANSTVLMASRWATRSRKGYLAWLELASHELFHAWNIKRLRPVELGPFDYESEVYSRALWVAEGITDYYGDLLVHRAGLSSVEEILESLSTKIAEVQTTPGRQVMTLEQASFDAWIKHYRPDENSPNVAMSYYTKGAVAAFILDAAIRARTHNGRSLDDVMRAAYRRYAGPSGFTSEQFRDIVEDTAGASLDWFWTDVIGGTLELDYTEALRVFGLRFRSVPPAPDDPVRAWLGAALKNDAGRVVVTQVRRDGPGWQAGLNVDDELLAIGEFRVRADQVETRLSHHRAGERVELLVARRDQLMRLPLTLASEPARTWQLEVDPGASEPARVARASWLKVTTA